MSQEDPVAGDGSGATSSGEDVVGGGSDADASGTADTSYDGVLGTYPYAFRRSPSRLLRSYAVLGGVATALVGLVFVSALVQLVANTTGTPGGTFTFVRAFYIVLGLAVVFPLMAPVLLVARRHRRTGSSLAYDRALAAGGYLFLLSLYLSLVVAAPPGLRETPPAVVGPLVEFLYALPPLAGVVPPLVAVAVGYLLHRRYR
jgi:uncharacterized membrane protein YuzA (DUF378 family)